MLYNNDIIAILNSKNIKSTAMRILVLQFFLDKNTAIGLPNLEEKFFFSERTTLYRTLKTFQEKGLVHQINDGTSSVKYALCDSSCSSKSHIDLHPHFYCEKCKETTCVNSISLPAINLENSKINSAELLIKGICNVCNKVA